MPVPAKRRMTPYPCIGYCMIDSRGHCVGCGRPPTMGIPGMPGIRAADTDESPPAAPAPGRAPAARNRK